MATPQDLEAIASKLPEVEVATRFPRFRMAQYKLAGKGFIGVDKNATHASFALDESAIQKLTHDNPDIFEAIIRAGKPIGVHADISRLTVRELRKLAASSWQHKAPKELAASHQICSRGHVSAKTSDSTTCPICWPGKHHGDMDANGES